MPQYIGQKLTQLKGEKNDSTIIVGDFSILLSIMDRTTQKINEETDDLNNIIKVDLTDINKTLLPTTEYTFAHKTNFQDIPYVRP